MTKHINFPTHKSGTTPDLVITTSPELVHAVETVGYLGASDHMSLLIHKNIMRKKQTVKKILNWNRADFEGIKNKLKSWNWREEFAERSMESCWKTFNDKVNSLVSSYVPETTMKSHNQPVWMNTRLLRTIRKKRSLWARYIKYRSESTLEK